MIKRYIRYKDHEYEEEYTGYGWDRTGRVYRLSRKGALKNNNNGASFLFLLQNPLL
jgi:hypothetical protein